MRQLPVFVSLLVGCGGFTINVDGATDDSLAYQALLFEGQCLEVDQIGERAVVTRVNLPRGGSDDGLDIGKLDQITYAIAVVGRDEMCRVRAFGCATFEPGPGDRATVAVTRTEIGPACPAREVCTSQVCEELESDGGVDAATDTEADVPIDAPLDAGPRDPCEVESSAVACFDDGDCAPPFLTCEGVCGPPASLACAAVPVTLPRVTDIVDVAIAHYLALDEPAEVEVWVVSSGELFAGRLMSEVSGGTLMLREFELASPDGIARAVSWADRHLVLTDTSPPGIFDYNPTPYDDPEEVPALAWAGQLPYCGSQNSGVPDAVLFGSRDPDTGSSTAFIADDFFWDDSAGDPMCEGDFDLGQIVTAVHGSNAAFADTSADHIAEIVPSTNTVLALYQEDRGVSVWDAQTVDMPGITPTIDLGLQSEVAPGWAAESSVYRLVTSAAGELQLRSVRNCSTTACNVSEPAVISSGAGASRLMLVELDDGRVLLVVRDGALDALFLSNGNISAGDPGALLATVRLSGEERIVDIDAFFDPAGNTFDVVALDEDDAPHLYRMSVP